MALLCATLAMFSKENGVTILAAFLLMDITHGVRTTRAGAATESTAAWVSRLVPARGGAMRGAAFAVWLAVVMSYRVSVHKGAALYKWTLLENQLSLMPPV